MLYIVVNNEGFELRHINGTLTHFETYSEAHDFFNQFVIDYLDIMFRAGEVVTPNEQERTFQKLLATWRIETFFEDE